jgi:hypothetical protein
MKPGIDYANELAKNAITIFTQQPVALQKFAE